MRISFRQGIVRHQTDANRNPTFLVVSGGSVSLNVSPDPTIVTFAHGDKNYVFTEKQSITNAWVGPFPSSAWLYWDIDTVTGVRTFGFTAVAPTHGANAPASPAMDQHWFDTANIKMKVWNGTRWIDKIRVFAARIMSGSVLTSMGADAPQFTGTQCGLAVSNNAGAIAYDKNGKPIKTGDGAFFTTEDLFTTGISNGSAIKVGATLVEAHATDDIPAGTVVMIKEHSEGHLADPFTYQNYIYGVAETQAMQGEVVRISTDGVASCSSWDWFSYPTNTPLYVGSNGQIQAGPSLPDQMPFAVVVDATTIMLKPAKMLVDLNASGVPNASDTTFGIVRLATDSSPIVVADDDPRLTDARTPLSHVHTIANVTGLQTSLDGKTDVGHTHTKSAITDFGHLHVIDDVTNLQTSLDGKSDTSHNHAGVYADAAHNHDGVYSLVAHNHDTIYATVIHGHAISDVVDLQTTLDGKSAVGHTHVEYSLATHNHDLDYSPIVHNHTTGDVDGLDLALAGKASSVHTHFAADVTDLTTEVQSVVTTQLGTTNIDDLADVDVATKATGDALTWNGTNWIASDPRLVSFAYANQAAFPGGMAPTLDGIFAHDADLIKMYYSHNGNWTLLANFNDLNDRPTKPTTATAGNFASLTGSGDLLDSGSNAASFAPVGHDHTGVYAPVVHGHDVTDIAGFNVAVQSLATGEITTSSISNLADVDTQSVAPITGDLLQWQALPTPNWVPFTPNYAAASHNHDGVYAKLVTPPTASTDPGNIGDYAVDATYTYFYTGTVWVRIINDTTPW